MTDNIRNGVVDAASTEKLWKEHHASLRAFIKKRGCNESLADDILQDVFVKAHTKLPDIRDPRKIRSWLYTTAKNTMADYFRTRRVAGEFIEELTIPQSETDYGQRAMGELSACLGPMIQQLPPPYRRALHLSELKGISRKELAALEGISLSGAKSRVSRGRVLLKEMLTDCCVVELDCRGIIYDYEQKGSAGNFFCCAEK